MLGNGTDVKERLAWLARATLAMVAVGISLRLVRYLQNFPMWCDETMLAANLLDRGFFDLPRPLDYRQVCPIGFLAMAWGAVRWLGFSETSLRLVPAIGSLASVPVFAWLAGRVLGRGTVGALVAVSLFAVSQPPIRYAGEFKPYATDLLAATVLLLLAVRWRDDPENPRWVWSLAAASPLCMAVSLPSLFVLASLGLVIAAEVALRRRVRLILPLAAFLVATLLGVATMAALGQYQTPPEDRAYFLSFWAQAFPPLVSDPWALAGWLIRTHTGPLFAYPHGTVRSLSWLNPVVAAGFAVGVGCRLRRNPEMVVLLVLPFGLALAASVFRRYPYGMSPRVAQFLVPSTLLLTAAGAERVIACLRDARLRRWAATVLVGLLVGQGVSGLATDLGRPYRAPWDRTAREFARWFWEEASAGSETVCVRTDLGLPFRPERWSYDGADQYLCYQRIFSARHRRGLPPRWDAVSASRPLRCVLLNRRPDEVPGFLAWLTTNRQRYALRGVRSYPASPGSAVEPALTYVVCELVPSVPDVAAGGTDAPARR